MTRVACALTFGFGLVTSACSAPERALQRDVRIGAELESGAILAAACSGCHGVGGEGVPSLVGLSALQVAEAMQDYKSQINGTTVMHRLARGYSDREIEQLSAYFASPKAN